MAEITKLGWSISNGGLISKIFVPEITLKSNEDIKLFDKAPVMVAGLDLNLPIQNFGGQSRPPISALSASFDKDAMCYAMFPALSVDPTYAR